MQIVTQIAKNSKNTNIYNCGAFLYKPEVGSFIVLYQLVFTLLREELVPGRHITPPRETLLVGWNSTAEEEGKGQHGKACEVYHYMELRTD